MSDNKKHDKHSPSSWSALMSCMGFKSTPTSSEMAHRGTLQHEYLEALGKNDKILKAKIQLQLTHKEISNVRYVFETVDNIIINEGANVEHVVFEEKLRIVSSKLQGKKGTGDVVIVCKDKVIIIDAKFGAIKDYDPQLKLYALGAMQSHGKDQAEYYISYGFMKLTHHNDISREEAQEFFDKGLDDIAYYEDHPEEISYKMNSFCQFCEQYEGCPELNKIPSFLSSASLPTYDMGLAEELLSDISAEETLMTMDIDKLSNLYIFMIYIDKYIDKVKSVFNDRLSSGEESLMYKMVKKAGNVFINDQEALIKNALERDPELDMMDLLSLINVTPKVAREWIFGADTKENKEDFESSYNEFLRNGKGSSYPRKRSKKDIEKLISKREEEQNV